MSKGQYTVWVWKDETGPRYVGWGKVCLKHPAKYAWALRESYKSELNDWLCQHEKEPERVDLGVLRYSREEASFVAQKLRKKYEREGSNLLASRPEGSYTGGGSARAVLGPDLQIYPSVRRAAVIEGVHPSTITRYCQTEDTDWDYLDQETNRND